MRGKLQCTLSQTVVAEYGGHRYRYRPSIPLRYTNTYISLLTNHIFIDLAITIQETYAALLSSLPPQSPLTSYRGCAMSGTSYPLGDVYPSVNGAPPVQKTGDAANFGLFKNNCQSPSVPFSFSNHVGRVFVAELIPTCVCRGNDPCQLSTIPGPAGQ